MEILQFIKLVFYKIVLAHRFTFNSLDLVSSNFTSLFALIDHPDTSQYFIQHLLIINFKFPCNMKQFFSFISIRFDYLNLFLSSYGLESAFLTCYMGPLRLLMNKLWSFWESCEMRRGKDVRGKKDVSGERKCEAWFDVYKYLVCTHSQNTKGEKGTSQTTTEPKPWEKKLLLLCLLLSIKKK